jgi:hypothetical protein
VVDVVEPTDMPDLEGWPLAMRVLVRLERPALPGVAAPSEPKKKSDVAFTKRRQTSYDEGSK